MAHNLFISYDLNFPGQGYDRITAAIKELGPWARVHRSLWYVNSTRSVEDAAQYLRSMIDQNDALIVIDASNNNAYWYTLDPQVSQHMIDNWYK